MNAIDDLKEIYPELTIWETPHKLWITGDESDVDLADARMDQYIPTKFKRILLAVDYETNKATRTYRRAE